MKNKLISIFLSLCIICSFVPAVTSAQAEADLQKEYALMELMGVFPKLSETDLTTGVTRAEFALALARMIKAESSKANDVRYFTDLSMSHWAHNAVNALVESGIISQPEDKLFHPDDYVTYNEAVKMMVCALGYEEYAQVRGGYPYGYVTAASKAKILDGVSDNGEFTLMDMLVLSTNTVCAGMYDISAIDGDAIVYESGNNTILSTYWDIYENEGYCDAVYGLSVSNSHPDKCEVIVDGITYNYGDVDPESFVGQYVNFFYRRSSKTDKSEIVYIESEYGEVVEFEANDFISVSSGTVSYYNKNDKKDSFRYNGIVIKNGTEVTKDISLAFNISNGSIKAVDSDGNGEFETVFINSFEIAKATSVDLDNDIIYGTDTNGKNIELSEKSNQIFRIKSTNKPNSDVKDVAVGALLHIYESDKVLTVYVTYDSFSGTIESMTDNGENSVVTVSGAEYPVYGYLMKESKLIIGNTYTFYPDRYGKITFADNGIASNMVYGFLHKVAIQEGMDNNLKMRIFTENEGMIEVKDNGKLTIDGDRFELDDALSHLNKYGKSELILFKLNSEGDVSVIDTRYKGTKESDYTLSCSFEDLAEAIFFNASGYSKFDRLGTFDLNNLRFVVPNLKIIEQADDEDFIAARSGYFSNNSKFSAVKLYTTNPDNMYDTVALVHSTGASDEHRPMLIDSVTRGVTEDGKILGMVTGIEDNYVSYYISKNFQKEWDALKLGQGDVVIVDTNAYGEIVGASVKLHYSAGDTQLNGILGIDASPSQARDITGGYVLKKVGNDIEWSYGSDTTTPYERLRISNDVKIAVYDSTRRVNKVYMGSINDVLDAESVGIKNSSSIILYAEYNKIGNIILHKRGWDD